MCNLCKKMTALLLLAAFFFLPGCSYDDREFFADISIPLQEYSAEIVIREWRWLLGSGAELYYQKNGKLTLLGTTTGGDDGYCPFKAGEFAVNVEENELIVRWSFRADDSEASWREKRFALPGA